jgi:hypothetical protein
MVASKFKSCSPDNTALTRRANGIASTRYHYLRDFGTKLARS